MAFFPDFGIELLRIVIDHATMDLVELMGARNNVKRHTLQIQEELVMEIELRVYFQKY